MTQAEASGELLGLRAEGDRELGAAPRESLQYGGRRDAIGPKTPLGGMTIFRVWEQK